MAWLWPGWIPQSLHNPCQGHPVAPPATPLLLPLPAELGRGCLAMKNFSEDQSHWKPYWKSLLKPCWKPYEAHTAANEVSLYFRYGITLDCSRMLWSNYFSGKLLSVRETSLRIHSPIGNPVGNSMRLILLPMKSPYIFTMESPLDCLQDALVKRLLWKIAIITLRT